MMVEEKKNDKTNHADANIELFVTKGANARTHAHIRFGGSASSEMYLQVALTNLVSFPQLNPVGQIFKRTLT